MENKKQKNNVLKQVFQFREVTLVIMIVLMFIIIPFFEPSFATQSNIISTLMSVATKGVIGIGVTIILVSGALDLSVGGLVAVTCASFGVFFRNTGSVGTALIGSFVVAIVFGMVNGLLVTRCQLSAFIATLATMGIGRGITFVLTKGTPIKLTTLPEWYKNLGSGKIAGIPYIIVLFVILVLVAQLFLSKSKILRQAVYTGSNEKTAQFSGINTKRVIFLIYVGIAVLCWISASLSAARFLTASPNYGNAWETDLIAAAVIGGATMDGGEGSVVGTALGLVLLGFVTSAIVLFGVSVHWQSLISSLILLIAVLLDAGVEMRKKKANNKKK